MSRIALKTAAGLGLLALAAAACADSSRPLSPARTSLDQTGALARANACAAPTRVVTTQAELEAALAAAASSDVIAISGTIPTTRDIEVRQAGVTLTCANPGDGLTAVGDPSEQFDLLVLAAPDVTVRGLVLDASSIDGAILALADGAEYDGRAARIIGNDIRCGNRCLFIVGASNSVITDNRLTAAVEFAASGIHIQGSATSRTDGVLIERNEITALVDIGAPRFGAIRPRDGKDVVIRGNTISGPWSNGIATAELSGSVFEHNTISGARSNGVYVGTPIAGITVRGLLLRSNVISASVRALFVNGACGNVFAGNRLTATATSIAAFFTATTGDNALMGHNGASVDNGAADCDGDGEVDPNFLSGQRRAGSEPGETIGPVMRYTARIALR